MKNIFERHNMSLEFAEKFEERIIMRNQEKGFSISGKKKQLIKNTIKGNVFLENYEPMTILPRN